jgi:hypothetical protein
VSVVADALVRRTDVETVMMRPLTDTEGDYIYDLCRQASILLRAAVPSVDERITAGTLDPELVGVVLAGVIKRYLDNPKGLSTISVATGPYSQSEGRASQITSDAGLLVTPADVNRLQPIGRTRTPGVVQLQPTTGNDPKSEWLSWSNTC